MSGCTVYQRMPWIKEAPNLGRRGWSRSAAVLGGRGGSRRIGSVGVADELNEHFSCSGVMSGGIEAQGLGKGHLGVLKSRAAE